MSHHEIDRAIDAAAGAMVAREPSRSLGSTVMARVRDDRPAAPWRFVWAAAAASLVVCGATAITLITQTPATIASLPRAPQLTVGRPPATPSASVALITDATPPRRAMQMVRVRRVATRALLAIDVSPIEPIQTDAIALSSIDVPQIERETTAIDTLRIEPLTIEPLATSND